jgi:uncharacterized protein YhfF
MDGNEKRIEEYWQYFLNQTAADETVQSAGYQAWAFGSTPEVADELLNLVLQGVKTATASLVWSYEAEGEALPVEGGYSIVLDGRGLPACVIQTTRLSTKPFDEVDAEQAFLEGEGDRSLDFWREVHWRYFGEECRQIGREPHLKMPVICERFIRVFP